MAVDRDNLARPDRSLRKAAMPPLPFEKHLKKDAERVVSEKEILRLSHQEEDLTLDEAKILVKNLEEKGKKFKNLLDDLYGMSRSSPDAILNYLKNPSNFSPKEWESLNEKRNALVESLHLSPEKRKYWERFAPSQANRPSSAQPAFKPSGSPDESHPQERRKKLGGARRGWIPMR